MKSTEEERDEFGIATRNEALGQGHRAASKDKGEVDSTVGWEAKDCHEDDGHDEEHHLNEGDVDGELFYDRGINREGSRCRDISSR